MTELERLRKIGRKIFGEGNNLVEEIMQLYYASTTKDDFEDRLRTLKGERNEEKSQREYVARKIEESEEILRKAKEFLEQHKQRPLEIVTMLDACLGNLGVTEKEILAKYLCRKLSLPLSLKPNYAEGLEKAEPDYYILDAPTQFRYWLTHFGQRDNRGIPFNEELLRTEITPFIVMSGTRDTQPVLKDKIEDSDLIKTISLFDIIPENISPEFVSHGVFCDADFDSCEAKRSALKRVRYNAYFEITRSEGDYRCDNWRKTDCFRVLHLVDFDKLLDITGMNDLTSKLTKYAEKIR